MGDALFDELAVALRKATHELNAIRARDGAPLCIQWGPSGPMQSFQCSEEYFNELVDECHAVLKKAHVRLCKKASAHADAIMSKMKDQSHG